MILMPFRPRPHLISKLYDAYPNQCVTCGRRFENTPEGKERKARHMDWHFKVKDPDMAKRGIHRSYYIGETVCLTEVLSDPIQLIKCTGLD
jgi:pre-mRNA cleavage complex 2 protein Pcf11